MATLPIKSILQQTEYSGHHGLLGCEAVGASFKLGNLISSDANGDFVETAVGAPAAAAKNKLAACDSGLRPGDRKLPYVDPNILMVFEVTATGAPLTAALAKPGATYGLARDAATGFHTLNLTDTTNAVWQVVAHNGGTIAAGAVGDTNARLFVKLLAR